MISLKINDLSFQYKSGFGLNLKGLNFNEAGVYSIVGPNGHGKSTFLKLLVNICHAQNLVLNFNSQKIEQTDIKQIARTFSYLPQFLEYDPLIKLVDLFHYSRYARMKNFRALTNDELEYRDQIFEQLELTQFKDRTLEQLSGGQLKLAFLGATFFQGSPVILLDEPFAALDPLVKNKAARFLGNSALHGPRIQLIVSHDFYWVGKMSDEILVFSNGELIDRFETIDEQSVKILENIFGTRFQKLDLGIYIPGDEL